MEEYIAPSYTKDILFSDDYLGFEKGTDLDFYSKTTGKLFPFSTAEQHYHLYVKTTEYLHIATKEHKSALLDQQFKIAHTFPYLYSSINSFLFTPFIIAKSKDGYDVYNTNQSFKLLHKQIKASDYSIIKILDKEKRLDYYAVFYGKETVDLYTEEFKLLKSIRAHAGTEMEAIAILKPYYKVNNEIENFDPPRAADITDWYIVRQEKGYKIYETQLFSSLYLKVNDRFDVQNTWSDEVKIFDKSAKETYVFKLNGTDKKALIPMKYQQLMGLEIIDRN
ncbi:hypothetical protein [Edaphocola aurantiacus]|uniref:hypothetical protein n=1 Tax=Edaphocola aurantiacus TaxID=2601682 RepID=UPI001C946B8F|nr:hypothetical protein [Edaphocola aurantiacus]